MTATSPTYSVDANCPQPMKDAPRWVLWKRERDTKVPYQARRPKERAASDDPETWSTYAAATYALQVNPSFAGIGFELGDGFAGVDLDDCRDPATGIICEDAWQIIRAIDSYSEVSPSQCGVKIFCRGTLPIDGTGKPTTKVQGFKRLEVYQHGRYFTVTGQHIEGTPLAVEDRTEQLHELYRQYWPEQGVQRTQQQAPPPVDSDAERRCMAYLDKVPESISGEQGHNKVLRAACECVRFNLDDAATWRVMQWFNANHCQPPWSDRELQHKIESARSKADGEAGTRLQQQSNGRHHNKPTDAPALTFRGPHNLTLTATGARGVGARGKVEAQFNVEIDGEKKAPLTVSTAASSIRDASRDLAAWIALANEADKLTKGEQVKVHQFVSETMAKANTLAEHFQQERARERAERPRLTPTGPTIQSTVITHAPRLAGLVFKNNDGTAWSETEGRDIDFREFRERMPPALVEACEQAVDYPEDRIGLSAPVGTIKSYLPMAWASHMERLPGEVRADAGPDSEAAQRYAQAIVRLWTIREKWKKTFARDGSEQAMDSATLAQLAREKVDVQAIDRASGWFRVHNAAIDAWACTTPRIGTDKLPTGEPPDAWLAFRYELVNQLPRHSRPDLPNTTGSWELGIIARRYGLTADDEPASPVAMVKEGGRQKRVVVLNRRLTDLILWQWDDGKEPDENSL